MLDVPLSLGSVVVIGGHQCPADLPAGSVLSAWAYDELQILAFKLEKY
jgi:hypothetical protein